MNVILLDNQRKMRLCILVFSGDDEETITTQTSEILVIKNINEHDCIVEIYKGAGDVLVKGKCI